MFPFSFFNFNTYTRASPQSKQDTHQTVRDAASGSLLPPPGGRRALSQRRSSGVRVEEEMDLPIGGDLIYSSQRGLDVSSALAPKSP